MCIQEESGRDEQGVGGDSLGTPSGESFLSIWKLRGFLLGWFKGKGGNGKFMIHDTDNRDAIAISVPQYFMLPNENI